MRSLTHTFLPHLAASRDLRPVLEVPERSELPGVDRLLDYERIQPTKQRKGKSGEVARRLGREG